MNKFIETMYQTLKGRNKSTVYRAYRKACADAGVPAASYKTFNHAIKLQDQHLQDAKRLGHRGAYGTKEYALHAGSENDRHGLYPFHIGHIDHTQLDVETIDRETGQPLGRPWLSLLIDGYSRRILAFVITFDPPSYRSCMILIRACVGRHSRLPQTIVVDGGKEFQGFYFDSLFSLYEMTKKVRPPAQPRFGSILERMFNTLNTQFIHNLEGNTKITRLRRTITKKTSPKNLAVWSLEELFSRLQSYFFEVYDQTEHTTLMSSPRTMFEKGLKESGERLTRLIPFDEGFNLATLPPAPNGLCKIHPNKGIRVGYVHYYHKIFRFPQYAGVKVEVRYDPYDASYAYAFVNKEWVKCEAWHGAMPPGTTEKQLEMAAVIFRRKAQLVDSNKAITQAALVELLQSTDDEELLLQRRKDRAFHRLSNPNAPTEEMPLLKPVVSIQQKDKTQQPDIENCAPALFENLRKLETL